MVDSVLVFRPDHRVTDADDNPVNNAKIKFHQTGPGAPRTVYSDAALTMPLGTVVYTRADGYPVVSQGSNTTTLIYTGTTAFHIEITDENDVAIFPAKDNVTGALDTSSFALITDLSTLNIPVISKTANYTVTTNDRGKIVSANASGGFFTITLPSAITAGDGFNFGITNDGSTGGVGVTAAHAIAVPMGNLTSFVLRRGEALWFESNGATWKTHAHKPQIAFGQLGRILIADRLSTPPGGPTGGVRYIVTAAPTGAWSGFAENDIAEADGQGGWFNFTPTTDNGMMAYVQDEDLYYVFIGSAWVAGLAPISALTEETSIDGIADFIPVYDTSITYPRKALPTNLKRSGGMQLLNSGSVTAAATLDIVLTSYTAYRALVFVLNAFVPVTDDVELWMRFSTNGGSSYDATGYQYAQIGARDDGTTLVYVGNAVNQIGVTGHANATRSISNVASEGGADAEITLHKQTDSGRFTKARMQSGWVEAAASMATMQGSALRATAQDTDAVRFLFESGNIATGDWALYGLI